LAADEGLAVGGLLPTGRVEAALEAEGVRFRDCLYTPLVTLWMFLGQVLDPDGSCRAAVARLLAFVEARGGGGDGAAGADPSAKTGPYCKARQRLPEGLIGRLMRESGRGLHDRYPATRLLGGRAVKVVDGTTVSMPDTPANQRAWPQPKAQKEGLGFPLARLVVVLSLSCAAVLGLVVGPYAGKRTGEPALLRTLLDAADPHALAAGDVLLADRYYASYWTIAALSARGVDVLFRQHHNRRVDFRAGTRLGRDDHLVTLARPAERPEWMDAGAYDALPADMVVREVRVRVGVRGFRVRSLVLVTTLTDAATYAKEEIAKAFRLRWHVELDLRAIKRTMGMDVLRCGTPQMVRKEIAMHLLAYNLVRGVMAEAADAAGVDPRELSFAGAVQTVNAFAPVLRLADASDLPRLGRILLDAIARHRVGDRPDRIEPRAVKRRAQPIALLTIPREQARRRLTRAAAAKG